MPVNPNIASLFKLLAVAYQPPAAGAWTHAVTGGSLERDLTATWRALDLPENALSHLSEGLAAYRGMDEDQALHRIRIEETRLFIGEDPLVEKSEGTWLQRAHGVKKPIRMINNHTQEVAEFMKTCGVARKDRYNDCIDYIENELDFCAYLAEDPAELHERGVEPLDQLDTFVEDHLQKWVPGFCKDVQSNAKEPYYPAVCALLGALVKEF